MVKIIQIAFISILEFVKKVKELEREGHRGVKHHGRKPAHAKELDFMRYWFGWAMTVSKNDMVDSVQVEDHVVTEIGGVRAGVASMAELNNLTKGDKSNRLEEQAGPLLYRWSVV